MEDIAKFLFEVGMLSKTPRSGFQFLGTGRQSVAEHLNRASYIGYVLASLQEGIDMSKVLKMCMFHDLTEARISDLNYVHHKYVERKEKKAIEDLTRPLPFGQDIKEILEEYERRETPEAILAKDADNIEWILSLKEQLDNGNSKASDWIKVALKRIKTRVAYELAEKILEIHSDDWYFEDKGENWWVNRNREETSRNNFGADANTDGDNKEDKDDDEGQVIFPEIMSDDEDDDENEEEDEDEENEDRKGKVVEVELEEESVTEDDGKGEVLSDEGIEEDEDEDEEEYEEEEESSEEGAAFPEYSLSKREKEILTLMDDVPADSYVEYVQRFTDYLRVNIVKIVEEFVKEGLLERITIPEGDDERSWYFHTKKVTRDMLDTEMLYRRDFYEEL